MDINNYPDINPLLLSKLKEDFPDKLPSEEINSFQLGILVGQQNIIKKLDFELKEQERNL